MRLLVLAALAAAVPLALGRARLWRIGRPARVDWSRGLLRLPRTYLRDVHNVVSRDWQAARMHIAAAGGFAGGAIFVLLVHVIGLRTPWLAWPLLVFLGLMLSGAGFAARRRRATRRLPGGAYAHLPAGLAVFAVGCGLATLPTAGAIEEPGWSSPFGLVALGLTASGLTAMVAFLPAGPMRHALAGALHLVAHPRPERLGARRPAAALVPLDLDAPKLGVEMPADLAWNRLLSFDACVQCGRCETACPAFAAGQPLNPRKLIQDLVFSLENYAGSRDRGNGAVEQAPGPEPDALWSCTTCRACVHECPMLIEHVDAVIELRRFQTLELGRVPGKAADALEELRTADNPRGFALCRRMDWAAGLDLRVLDEGNSCDVLLWLGDAAFDLRGQRTLRALVRLLLKAGVDFAVLGEAELDCGDLARRLGDDVTFQSLARRNIAELAARRFERILTADPHAYNVLRNEYPALGGSWAVVHHAAFLHSLVAAGRLTPRNMPAGPLTYHDPCYLGRYNGEIEAPRALLDALGAERLEMPRHGMAAMCCGGGGGAPLTDIPGRRRIPDLRMEEARATGAATLAVACPNCAVMLEGVPGPRPQVRDVAELLLEAVKEGV